MAITDIWFNRDMQAVNDLVFALALQMKVESHPSCQSIYQRFLDTDTYWNTTIVEETTNDGGQKETCKFILPCCASDNCVMTGTLLSEKASQFSQN